MKKIIIITFSIIAFLPAKEICGQWTTGSDVVWTDDQVGINTSSPASNTSLDIVGTYSSGTYYGIQNRVVADGTNIEANIANRTAFGSLSYSKADLWGMFGYISNLSLLKNSSLSTYSKIRGVSGAVVIDDPIPSGYASTGSYYITGVSAHLAGNISVYPTNGLVSAFYSVDNIKGVNTWSGYFEGDTYFEDSVGIGTKEFDGYMLAVAGKIRATEVKIESLPWSDFVFKENYNLMSLSSLKDYIQENHHLPDIPSEEEVKKDGISLGEMDALLLQKIEELTLYVIELKEENQELETRLSLLEK